MFDGIHVLHVDDDPEFAELAATLLEREDDRLTVHTAADASEGLAYLDDADVDCILSDYGMPGRNGIELLETVRERRPTLPFVLYTGNGGEDVAREAIAAGATDYHRKGSGTSQYAILANRITNAVERARTRQRIEAAEHGSDRSADANRTAAGAFDDLPAALRAFRGAVESTGHAIYWTDTGGTIEYVNSAFEAQTGFTATEAVGRNANILQSGAHDERFYEDLWDTILDGEVWEGEIVNARRNGERYVVSQTISPITDESGDIVRFVAVNEDVTELRESRERLERQRDRFAELLDVVPVPLVLVDLAPDEPVIKQANRRFKGVFGFSGMELGGSPLWKFTVGDDAQIESGLDAVRRGQRVQRELSRRTDEGDSRTYLFTATALTGVGGEEMLATYIDVTDRKRTEEKLRRRTEELEDFASVVSHDLRNPLNVAMGHLELLAEDAEAPEVEPIRNAHARMQELIENILMLARQGKTVGETEEVSLSDCLSRSWETVDTVDADLAVEADATVHADEGRLRQLFGNLIRNAVEHGGDDVTIAAGVLDDYGGFYVADDGPGIPADERDAVFDAGHTSTETGTGFGLSIVREIVDAHGWSITATESDDGGARFEVTGVELTVAEATAR